MTCTLSRFSHVRLCVTPWTVALQASLSMRFSGQEYWSGLPFPSPGDLPDPGIKSESLISLALAGRFFTTPQWQPKTKTKSEKNAKKLILFPVLILLPVYPFSLILLSSLVLSQLYP